MDRVLIKGHRRGGDDEHRTAPVSFAIALRSTVAVIAFAIASPVCAQTSEPPALPRAKTAAELGLGLVGGVSGLLVGKMVGDIGASPPVHDDQWSRGGLIGALAGHVFGSAFGVYAAGKMVNARESFGATIAGAAIGEALGIGLYTHILRKANGDDRALKWAWLALMTGAPIGATIGFDVSRQRLASASSAGIRANARMRRASSTPLFALRLPF